MGSNVMTEQPSVLTTTQMLEALRDPANGGVWAALDARYRPVIFGVARRAGLGAEDAADVTQECLADVVEGYREGRYDRGKGRLRSWIMTIAYRRVTDAIRARYRKGDQSPGRRGDSAIGDLPSDGELERAWKAEEERELLNGAVSQLLEDPATSASSKRVFELIHLRALSPEAVAAECGMSCDQVYVIKHRMLTRLRERVEALKEAMEIREGG
jgi:RNA polymerase sigma-70 factor (ECF subfamily)